METGNAVSVTTNGNPPLKSASNTADALLSQGRLDDARAAYRQILEHEPNDIRAMLALGRVERRLGDDRAACNCLRDAVTIDPDNLPALTDLAAVLRDLSRPEEAASIYRKILAIDREHVQAHMGLGSIARAC